MEAGPRDKQQQPELEEPSESDELTQDGPGNGADQAAGRDGRFGVSSGVHGGLHGVGVGGGINGDATDADVPADAVDAVPGDGATGDGTADDGTAGGESFRELRPPRRLRAWQLAPIVGLAALGSLMFAFPLAFEFGDGGAIVAMLGLLISGCAAGWAMMAGRRVGLTWPGLPSRGSGTRPDWRVIALYAVTVGVITALAIWRVARLR